MFGAVSWDYRVTPEEFQNKLGLSSDHWFELAKDLRLDGHVLLVTCNRVEFYFTFDPENVGEDLLRENFPNLLIQHDAIMHLFRVTAGLESMSVGENEILSQVKTAYEKSVNAGCSDKLISLIFRKAISVGKSVREKTKISRGKTSIPVIAVDVAARHSHIKSSSVCIIGTGQMAETFVRYLLKKEPQKITIVGRSGEKAQLLAERYSCSHAVLQDLPEIIGESDIVFAATSSKNVIVDRNTVPTEMGQKILVDISNPRNIDPELSDMPGVKIYSLRDIQSISSSNTSLKKEEIPKAESIVSEEFSKFGTKLSQYRAEELLNRSHTFAESIAMMEINRMLIEIKKGMDPVEAKRKSASAMANRILGKYTAALKEAALNGDAELLAKLQAIFQ